MSPFTMSCCVIGQQLLGSSITAVRAFSAVWGSLSLVGIYLLVKKLFEIEEVARITTSLVAVSPTMIRYSQDARPYSLWVFCGVISTYALLSALDKKSFKNWFALSTFYCRYLLHPATIAISLYRSWTLCFNYQRYAA